VNGRRRRRRRRRRRSVMLLESLWDLFFLAVST
jgi:hypothetical protein